MLKKSAFIVVLTLILAGCGGGGDSSDTTAAGGDGLSGRIEIDGSSTVGPLLTVAAEQFQQQHSDTQVTVGISGTGGGFERFCAGETDISTASRPIKDEEREACETKGVAFSEVQVANDALTVVVSKDNDWATCLTVEQLKTIWEPGSKVKSWKDVDPSFPDEEIRLFGAGTDSGTFDYFTDAIVGEEGASRSDYSATEDDNVTVTGVGGSKGGLGYFGLSYFEENESTLKAVEIDGGNGCVAPSTATAQDGTYAPLARPLFIYVKSESLQQPEVKAFADFVIDEAQSIAETARFVPLTAEQQTKAREALAAAEGTGTTG